MFISYEYILPIGLIILGIINCFFGYKLFKILLFIIGFVFAFYLSYKLMLNFTNDKTFLMVIGLIIGLVVGILSVFFYFSGVFLIGLLFGILVGLSLNIPFDEITRVAIIIGLGVIFGILCLIFQKYIVVVFTFFTVGFLIIHSFFYIYFLYIGKKFPIENIFFVIQKNTTFYIIMLFFTLIFGILGILFQYKAFKKE
ncbi:MAG TPA: DUF4203 domain-containing protein [Spirochaetota bacterium]|nr:DUF4203 domain-containing protein [Spirochaetota bacterium]